jgi:hypothetical protein
MKFNMYFGRLKTALICVVIAGALAVFALDVALLVGVDGLKTSSPVVAGCSMAAATIVAVAALLILLNSSYRFGDYELKVTLGFFADKIEYEKITAIKQNAKNKDVYILYAEGETGEEVQNIRLNLSPSKTDAFLAEMRRYCPFIIVEPFTPPEKKKK